MKNIPKEIYIQIGDDVSIKDNIDFKDLTEVTWSADRINNTDIIYCRKQENKISVSPVLSDSLPKMEITKWIESIIEGSGGFKVCEETEIMVHHISREHSIAVWTIRCLANTLCEGSDGVIAAIIERRKKVLGNV